MATYCIKLESQPWLPNYNIGYPHIVYKIGTNTLVTTEHTKQDIQNTCVATNSIKQEPHRIVATCCIKQDQSTHEFLMYKI